MYGVLEFFFFYMVKIGELLLDRLFLNSIGFICVFLVEVWIEVNKGCLINDWNVGSCVCENKSIEGIMWDKFIFNIWG